MSPPTSSHRRTVVAAVTVLLGLSLAACGPPDPPEQTGPAGPLGPVARACDGVAVTPADEIQVVVDAHPPGTTFCLAAGTHRVDTPVVPRNGDSFRGEAGAVLSGSKELTEWVRVDGSRWTSAAFLPADPTTYGECDAAEPACSYVEDVFLDKQRLRRVSSAADLTPGTFFADYRNNAVVLLDDPRERLVEQAVAPSLIRATVDDVTVENLVVEQAANEAQVGAIENRQVEPEETGSGWRILHNEVRLNHGVGIGFGDRTTVSGNVIRDQGQMGFGAWGSDSVVSNNEIASNGVAGYSSEWEAGGSKSYLTQDLVLSHNHVHDNRGPGLWADGGNSRTTYEYNLIVDNWGPGIQHEISYDAVIRHNVVTGNGLRSHKGWAWEAGIQIQSSGGVELIEVAHNVVSGNANGITLLDSGNRASEYPAPYGPHVVQNVWVHDNVISMAEGQSTGAVQDTGSPNVFTSGNNRFDDNTYRLGSLTGPHFLWGDEDVDWLHWTGSGAGNDIGGRASLLPAG